MNHLIKMAIDDILYIINSHTPIPKENNPELTEKVVKAIGLARNDLNANYTFAKNFPETISKIKEDLIDVKLIQVNNFANVIKSIPKWQSLGDTIGYYNGKWEFNYNTPPEPHMVNDMLYEFINLGGISDINLNNWAASDDTILYLDTFEVMIKSFDEDDIDKVGNNLRDAYLKSLPNLKKRDPGINTINSLEIQKNIKWNELQYNPQNIGNGSVMRAGCIGILFPNTYDRVIEFAIASSIITHNSTIAVLGSITSALFTVFALRRDDIIKWPHQLMQIIDSEHVEKTYLGMAKVTKEQFVIGKQLFMGAWKSYIQKFIRGNTLAPETTWMMQNLVERYRYLSNNFSKGCLFPGGCADDCLIMAYDSLIRCDGSIEKLLVLSALHPGDSDTVSSVAFSWYGAFYGNYERVSFADKMFDSLEFKSRIELLGNYMEELTYYIYFTRLLPSMTIKYVLP